MSKFNLNCFILKLETLSAVTNKKDMTRGQRNLSFIPSFLDVKELFQAHEVSRKQVKIAVFKLWQKIFQFVRF